VAKDVRGIVFDGDQVTPEKGPVFAFTNAAEVMIRRTKAPKETDVFLSVAGKNSERIRIEASDLSGAKQPFTTAPEVKENAVSVK
jgi:hypothetical protein